MDDEMQNLVDELSSLIENCLENNGNEDDFQKAMQFLEDIGNVLSEKCMAFNEQA